MGGCKCSYRNCTAKTNGQIHLFHYPVFNRPRCNKWLINAQRQEFLDLKVSQLKNRVVCQYHFKDDDFMNSLKDKLKPSAVPTLNGPYCDPSEWGGGDAEENMDLMDLEDIENDLYLNYEKKDFGSRQYGNFLTESDLLDLGISYQNPRTPKKVVSIIRNPLPVNQEINLKPEIEDQKQSTKKRQLNLEELTRTPQKRSYQSPGSLKISKIEIISDEKVTKALKGVPKLKPVKHDSLLPLPMRSIHPRQNTKENNTSSKHIIKEEIATNETNVSSDTKTYSRNVEINTQPVKEIQPQSFEIPVITKHLSQNVENNNSIPAIETHPQSYEIPVITPIDLPVYNLGTTETLNLQQLHSDEGFKLIEIQDDEGKQILNFNQLQNPAQEKNMKVTNYTLQEKKTKVKNAIPKTPEKAVSLLKNKMCSKRLSAIKQKRDFNKRLTDIISSQMLNESEKHLNIADKPKDSQNLSMADVKSSNIKSYEKQVKTHLSEDTSLVSSNEYSIAALEHRMKKMEQMLLQKMEDNTKIVQNLKKSLDSKPTSFKSVTTQTAFDEESHKKNLYREISKYLSPAANSFIFEELFINKYEPKRKLRR